MRRLDSAAAKVNPFLTVIAIGLCNDHAYFFLDASHQRDATTDHAS